MIEKSSDCGIAYNFLYLQLLFYIGLLSTIVTMFIFYKERRKTTVSVINTHSECFQICKTIQKHCLELPAIGFDAEWVDKHGRVALIQICTGNRTCGLFRLTHLKTIPNCLQKILQDPKIVKLGVGTGNDAKRLLRDFSIQVKATLDLRNLFYTHHGLAKLSDEILGIRLDKEMQCSNWEADYLNDRQVQYAVMDAYVAIEMFKKWININFDNKTNWTTVYQRLSENVDKPVAVEQKNGTKNMHKRSKKYKAFTQKGEIYSHCLLLAPDNSILCTCSKSKVDWYLKHNRAELITEDPLTIRLLFEPKRKPTGTTQRFLSELKQNICVVCGTDADLLKYRVIPRVISKCFPIHLKSHCSHDVVVLCLTCHQKADHVRKMFICLTAPLNATQHNNQDFGINFIEQFTKNGKSLFDLQREFRVNFLNEMEPEHLPKNWSVDHVN